MLPIRYGTFSTGISINNIHNVILTESFKSDSLIRQSIGRGLRKHSSKDKLIVIDLVDDLSYRYDDTIRWKNYTYKHGEYRMNIYKEQKFPYKTKIIPV